MFGISRTDERLTALLIPTTDGTDSQYRTLENCALWGTVGGDRSRRLTRAERKAGELLQQLERDKGGRPAENSFQAGTSFSEYRAVLTDSDIAPTTAHRWQTVLTQQNGIYVGPSQSHNLSYQIENVKHLLQNCEILE